MNSQSLTKCDKNNPLILVNFKNFAETNGENALRVAKRLDQADTDTSLQIGVCVQPFFCSGVRELTGLLLFGQHVDADGFGSCTGALIPEALKSVGAVGSIINHSEKRLSAEVVKKTVLRLKETGLKSVVCVESVKEAREYALFGPDFIAIEPPELIGGDISVSTAKPELIKEAVEAVDGIPLLVGAGIKDGNDLKVALDLGAVGILVASGVCKASDPYEVMMDFASVL
jgi:triosephosphate isomerase